MKKPIVAFINELKSSKKRTNADEASIKQGIVLRLLSFLGWDIFDVEEVCPDYSINSRLVSYALRTNGKNQVLMEVKGGDEKLEEHQKQLLAAAAQENVALCVLTNGTLWWLYLAAGRSGRVYQRFLACDFLQQKPGEVAPQLIDCLSRADVASGDALKSAETIYRGQKQKLAAEALPEAWNQLLAPPNKILVEILAESSEKLCGYRAETRLVEKFIESNLSRWRLEIPDGFRPIGTVEGHDHPTAAACAENTTASTVQLEMTSYADKRIKSYALNGHTHTVRSWEEMLLSLCEFFAAAHSRDFEKVLWISDDQHPYFSTYSDQLRIPEKIKKTNIYVETKLDPDEIVKIAEDLLAEFGYDEDALEITTD